MTVTDLKAGNGASYTPVASSDEKPKLEQMELDESKTKVTNVLFFQYLCLSEILLYFLIE